MVPPPSSNLSQPNEAGRAFARLEFLLLPNAFCTLDAEQQGPRTPASCQAMVRCAL